NRGTPGLAGVYGADRREAAVDAVGATVGMRRQLPVDIGGDCDQQAREDDESTDQLREMLEEDRIGLGYGIAHEATSCWRPARLPSAGMTDKYSDRCRTAEGRARPRWPPREVRAIMRGASARRV